MSSSVVFQRLLLDLWAGIRGVLVSLSRGATHLGPTGRASVFRENNVPPAYMSDPPAIFARKEVPPYYAQKMNTPPVSWDPV